MIRFDGCTNADARVDRLRVELENVCRTSKAESKEAVAPPPPYWHVGGDRNTLKREYFELRSNTGIFSFAILPKKNINPSLTCRNHATHF